MIQKSMKIKKCKYLPDGNGAYVLRLAKQGGMAASQCSIQMYNKGMGIRSWRWVLLIENNIQMSYLEEETPDNKGSRDNLEDDPFELTHAQQMLDLLKNRDQIDHIKEENDATDKFLDTYDILFNRDQVDHINEVNANADKGNHRPEGVPISPGG